MAPFTLPPIGLGTNPMKGPTCRNVVETAIDLGYRHIDTAQMYGNEADVGAAIEGSPVDRSDLIIATKVHPDNLAYDDVITTVRASADRLGLETIDLIYIHWPTDAYDPDTTLSAFEELYDEGLFRALGVSNFSPEQIDDVLDRISIPVVANQIELHPLLQQRDLREYVADTDLTLVGYSPILKGRAADIPELVSIAEKHGITPTQVCLAWIVAIDAVAVPKASSRAHLDQNLAAADVSLDDEDVEAIAAIGTERRLVSRPGAPWTT